MNIALRFDGPVLSAGLGTTTYGLDAQMQRDARRRRIVPAAHLRGRMREALVELLAMATGSASQAEEVAGRLFGAPEGTPGDQAAGSRGTLRFHDLVHQPDRPSPASSASTSHDLVPVTMEHLRVDPTAHEEGGIQPRVAIDGHTGTARRAHLGFLEADPSGTTSWFAGQIDLPAGGALGLDKDELATLLAWCLRWVGEVGRTGTAGWGRIQERVISVDRWEEANLEALLQRVAAAAFEGDSPAPVERPAVEAAGRQAEFDVLIVLHGPMVIADGKAGPNVFESRLDIPGSVLRRGLADVLCEAAGKRRGGWVDHTLAQRLEDLGASDDAALARRFAQVKANFALPVPADQALRAPAPLPRPLSAWVEQDKDGEVVAWHDALSEILDGAPPAGFRKTSALDVLGYVSQAQGDLPLSLRTHVAKSARTGAGMDGQLFSYHAIDEVAPGAALRTCFRARIRCPDDLEAACRSALARVRWLGKATGRGYGKVRIHAAPSSPAVVDSWWEDLLTWNRKHRTTASVPLTLVTEALLVDCAAVDIAQDLTSAYTAAWREILDVDTLSVRLVLAHHRLRGPITARGLHIAPPLLLTQPGSTFVLDLPGSLKGHKAALEEVLEQGAQRPTLVKLADESWHQPIPYTTDNGYGAVVVHDMHLESATR